MHEVGAGAPGGHREVHAHRAQRRVGAGQLGRLAVRGHPAGVGRRGSPKQCTRTSASGRRLAPGTRRGPRRRRRHPADTPGSADRHARREQLVPPLTTYGWRRWTALVSVGHHGCSEGPRDRAGRRRGQASDAADRGSGQAGGALRRALPDGRLRAVQPGQCRLPQDRRADPVQVALARPAHHQDLADVQPARQLRHPGTGPAAARAVLVRRLGRRDPPELQPDQRRAAGLRHRLRRRPHLPDGP